jgi:hypothetical protein
MDRKTLNNRLIEHYDCFNREVLWLDEYNEKDGFVSIVHPTYTTVRLNLCRGIARFIKKQIEYTKFKYIYVGAYVFETAKL